MDAQDFRSLQEAYMEVVENQQLDEAQVPDTQKRADRIMKQSVKLHTTAVEKGQPKKHRQAATLASTSRRMSQRAKERDQEAERQEFNVKEDIYDIILSHLLDEGYAETPEAAEAIMVNMSEEWREDIMEKEDSEYEKASDAALDKRYGYGRATGDKRSFGRAANRSSAAAALRALRRGERSGSGTSTEAGADAVLQGWAKTAKTSTDQTPEKKERRSKLANTEYKDLPDDEKEKDRVSFNAVKATYKNRNR